MKVTGILILSSLALATSGPSFTTPKRNTYGLHQYAPGVVGSQIQRVKNTGHYEPGVLSRLNERLTMKLKNSAHIDLIKNTINSLFAREDNTDDDIMAGNFTDMATTTTSVYAESIQNKLTYYLLNITLGTPQQQFMVQVDTGSSDLWVPGRSIQFNGFDSKHSRTVKHLSDDFNIKYVKDSAQGYWAVDNFGFGGQDVEVDNLQFGVATSAPDSTMGILGIGPIESETSKDSYPNLPIMLVRDGLIARSVYSMYMGGLESEQGTILFGGSDKAKYKQLTTLPIVSKSSIQVELDIIALTTSTGPDGSGDSSSDSQIVVEDSVYTNKYGYYKTADRNSDDLVIQNDDVISSNQPLNVLLDTGTSLTYLPTDTVQSIASSFQATYDSEVGMYIVHQDDLSNNALQGINFQFENQIVYMPRSELFWPLSWFSLEPSSYYAMTILASDSSMGYDILGDSFLRNAYVIYDLDEKEVHIGQYYPSEYSHIVSF